MATYLKPDLCIIGGGAGGLSTAAAAAAFGVPTVLVERDRMGGECLYSGCVPSKALIAAARRAHALAGAADLGIMVQGSSVDYRRVRDHIRSVIAAIAPNDSVERFTGLGVRVIDGSATFTNRRTVTVGDVAIRARRFVIATGSKPALPEIEGLASVPYLTNETVFDLAVRPDHLMIVGGGATGMELAQAYRRLGAAVTLVEAAAVLEREDRECVQVILGQFEREGIAVLAGTKVLRAAPAGAGIALTITDRNGEGERTIEGSHLLIATGRTPNVDGLGLDAAHVRYDQGGIAVDRRMRTTNRRVYAVGDVTGGPQLTHAASHHAGIVIQNALFRRPAVAADDAMPRVTFTDPELAQVGLTEDEARRRGIAIEVARWPYHENDRAQAERQTQGHIKIVSDRRGVILGATIVGMTAGELITTWTLAVGRRLDWRALAGLVVPYPTLGEIGKRAAIAHLAPRFTGAAVRRIVGLLRRFG